MVKNRVSERDSHGRLEISLEEAEKFVLKVANL